MFKNKHGIVTGAIVCVTLAVFELSPAGAQHYVVTNIGKQSGYTSSSAWDINESGQVA